MLKNISLSFGINFINLLFPLLLIPFYIKTFGINTYGLIAISLSLVNIISVIYDYSWYAFAPIEIQKIKNDSSLVNQYISKVINTKIVLFLPSVLFLLFYILYFDNLKNEVIFSFSLLVFLFSRSQNNLCFFIGLNNVTPYFIINAIVKITCIILIILILTQKSDFQYLFYYLGISEILIFIFSTYFLIKKCNFKYTISSKSEISEELKNGFKLFLTNLTISALLNSNTIILGVFLDTKIAGIYNVAEKIIMLCKQSISVLFQGVYYKACSIGVSKTVQLNNFFKSAFFYYLLIYGLGTTILFIFPNLIIHILSNEATIESSHYLILLAPIPLISALSQSAYMSLILHHKKNIYFYAHLFGLFLNVFLGIILCYFLKVYGTIIALILTEIFITLYLNFAIISEKKLNFFKA
ncbi:oligosaccharide flippase family protein [Flavobacterium sp.]|uniref:oligosaccharide flippase family protein n=1 Tax=Flavobacterium sp. TaxID=239 RepID=UPI003D12DEDE